MRNTRHIFVQVDTESVLINNPYPTAPVSVCEHSLIYDQGSMALGNAVTNFIVDANTDQTIHFTILPLKLFSFHKLYFTDFAAVVKEGQMKIPTKIDFPDQPLSFSIFLGDASKNSLAVFTLGATLEFERVTEDGKREKLKMEIVIDPVLRANQGTIHSEK